MKKLFVLFVAVTLSLISFGQVERVITAPYDTVQKVETIYTGNAYVRGTYGLLTIQALCTELGGTSDGTLILQGSVDGTSYINLAPETGVYIYRPNNDTLTITSGAIQTVEIHDPGFSYYRWKVTGTANDTTLITTKYTYKNQK